MLKTYRPGRDVRVVPVPLARDSLLPPQPMRAAFDMPRAVDSREDFDRLIEPLPTELNHPTVEVVREPNFDQVITSHHVDDAGLDAGVDRITNARVSFIGERQLALFLQERAPLRERFYVEAVMGSGALTCIERFQDAQVSEF